MYMEENEPVLKAFRSLERDAYPNEEKTGPKDRILENKHHAHAALRYAYQMRMMFVPKSIVVPHFNYTDEAACY